MHSLKLIVPGLLVAAMVSCSHEQFEPTPQEKEVGKIVIQGDIKQVNNTKATATGFTDGDRFAVYIVDYNQDGTPGILVNSGNRADNLKFTFSEPQTWTPDHDVYWRDDHTAIDVYGYYPVANVDDVNNLPFEIAQDQNSDHADGSMSGYESSDFLWGKVSGATVAGGLINILFEHKMACARIRLVEGEGFEDGEWARLQKNVVISNTARKGVIDLATGLATASSEIQPDGIIPQKEGDEFRAVVLPQSISADTKLFAITVNGVNYIFRKNADFEYVPGRMHNFDVEVTKKAAAGDYVFNITSESITAWEIDKKSHDGLQREYVIVNSTAGHLKECIEGAGKKLSEISNLKITGEISGDDNSVDFQCLREQMPKLQYLNLKETKIAGGKIPNNAFFSKSTLVSVILPESGLTEIGGNAFYDCSCLVGNIIIPEGITHIHGGAFYGCSQIRGELVLPSTLQYIGDHAFYQCGCTSENFVLPRNIKYIGSYAFYGTWLGRGCSLVLPESLETIGERAFYRLGFKGSLSIPHKITKIESDCFFDCGFDGTLTLPDGLLEIGNRAFYGCHFSGSLELPKDLMKVETASFQDNNFDGQLLLHDKVSYIGTNAFMNCGFQGTLDIPTSVRILERQAFAGSKFDEIIIPNSIEVLGGFTFGDTKLKRVIMKSQVPPSCDRNVFSGKGTNKEDGKTFRIEVPEGSLQDYVLADGWSQLKTSLLEYHVLESKPTFLNLINKSYTQEIILNAEGPWSVVECPDWISVDVPNGDGKTIVNITVSDLAGTNREGDVIFGLDNADYTFSFHVKQYDSQYADGAVIKLSSCTKGSGVKVVFMGDGFDAEDISNGRYMSVMQQQYDDFFAVEPYTTYKDYFDVYAVVAHSLERGLSSVSSRINNKFGSRQLGGVAMDYDIDKLFDFVVSSVNDISEEDLDETLIVLTENTDLYAGITYMWSSGKAVSLCGLCSKGTYPSDRRGVLQHEACGHGFGKLFDEYIYSYSFIDACTCSNEHVPEFNVQKSWGFGDNLSLSGNFREVPWSHLIFDKRYSSYVDVYEGGFFHKGGVFRSEKNSCMNNNIPYFSAISRESIVRRIKKYAGEPFDFEEFVANDKITSDNELTKSAMLTEISINVPQLSKPVIIKD